MTGDKYTEMLDVMIKLREDNENLSEANKQSQELLMPIIEWGQSNLEDGLLGTSVTKEVLRRAKCYDNLKQANKELLEALDESLAFMNSQLKWRLTFSNIDTDSLTNDIFRGIQKFEALRKQSKL